MTIGMKSQQEESHLIWFQLKDATTGEAFRNTTCDSIVRSSLVAPVIAQFRKAVSAQYPLNLLDIPASLLLVYKNRECFERREEPLKEDKELKGLGGSGTQALIVLVPTGGTNTDVKFQTLDVKTSLSPLDVSLPELGSEEPQFIARAIESNGVIYDWREFAVGLILSWLGKEDGTDRVPPMALARCTRGGKTRALKEIAMLLKKRRPDVSVIYISFNDWTCVKEWEQNNPIQILCRRIAYREKPATMDSLCFSEFGYSLAVEEWLGNTPCVLLVDELNQLNCLHGDNDEKKRIGAEFARFINKVFLGNKGRYFVFSSHIVPASLKLTIYMENMGNRDYVCQQLPVIDDLTVCNELLHLDQKLNARKALFYG
jgi:hypothetical protein